MGLNRWLRQKDFGATKILGALRFLLAALG
jgi:hypothetical protein